METPPQRTLSRQPVRFLSAQDSCQSDSGGGLLVDDAMQRVLVGIVGREVGRGGCGGDGVFGVYTRVSMVRAWVEAKIGALPGRLSEVGALWSARMSIRLPCNTLNPPVPLPDVPGKLPFRSIEQCKVCAVALPPPAAVACALSIALTDGGHWSADGGRRCARCPAGASAL
jgi:hypothetical protein